MLDLLKRAWEARDLRRKIIFTLIILGVFRIVSHIPLPEVNPAVLRKAFSGNPFFGLFDLFSGGAFQNLSVVSLGLNPYINASIIIQLLTMIYPSLEELSKEGEFGREKINQYTRLLSLPLTLLQSYATYYLLSSQGFIGKLSPLSLITLTISLTAGSVFLMWLGEVLTDNGIGNGISLLIFAGITARFPTSLGQVLVSTTGEGLTNIFIFALLAVVVVAGVVFVNEAVRQVRVEYARRSRSGSSLGTQASYLPLRVNQAGVIPIIFAISLVLLPSLLAQYLRGAGNPKLLEVSNFLLKAFSPNSPYYSLLYFFLVVVFTYFYTAVTFNPEKIADEIKRYGGFIPGIRPGKSTAEYLGRILRRITLAGAVFLGLMAILPTLGQNLTQITAFSLGGTSILIVVSVVLETLKQVKAQVDTRSYEEFLR